MSMPATRKPSVRRTWRSPDPAAVLVIALVLVLAALPVVRLAGAALAPGGTFDLAGFAARLSRPATIRATWQTLDTAFFGAMLSLAIGAPFAVAVSMTDLPGRRALGFLFLLPLMIAPQVTALAWLHLFGPSSALLGMLGLAPPVGTVNPLLGRNGIILLYGIQHAPIVFVTLRTALARVPGDFVRAAHALGATPGRALVDIVLPLVSRALAAGTVLAFVSGIGNFGIPALLGMPVNYLTLTTLIYQRLSSFGPDVLPEVAALSVLIGVLAIIGVAFQFWATRGGDDRFVAGDPVRFPLGRLRPAFAMLAWTAITLMLMLPATALIATSLVPAVGVRLSGSTATLANYVEVLFRQASTIRAFTNSFLLAGGAALILALIAIPAAWAMERMSPRQRAALQAVAELPYALPGVVLAIACILLFLRPLPLIGSLYGTAVIILIAYLMRFFTLALKPVAVALAQMPRELDDAAAACGARPLVRLATITAPLAASAAAAGAVLVFMSAFNELTVSALLWSSGRETLGVILFSLEEAGLAPQAAAVASLTLAVVLLLLAAIDRLGRRLPAGVLPWR